MFSGVDLRQDQPANLRPDRGLDVLHRHGRGPIDPHQHVGAIAGHRFGDIADQGPGARLLGWRDRLPGSASIEWLADWYRALNRNDDMQIFTLSQIAAYEDRYRKGLGA